MRRGPYLEAIHFILVQSVDSCLGRDRGFGERRARKSSGWVHVRISVERTVLNLYRNGYVKRRLLGGPALGFDYQLTEKGLQALTDRKYVEKT